jgi:hypothetical protein
MTFSDAIAALRQGQAYVNLHSTASPDGEIRGQVGPVSLVAQLNGLQEAPPVATAATGTMSLTLSDDQASISFSLNVTGLANITAAHIHAAPPGIDGPIIFPLATGPYSTPLTGTLTAAQFTPPITGFATFAEAVDGMIAGLTYANVHTTTYPDGEIRGQIRGEQAPVPPTKPGR